MITAKALAKQFTKGKKTVDAVRGIDIEVADGELVALLGPNGAGKSTTLRMLTTLLTPTSGEAWIGGYSITSQREHVRRQIGYVGQGTGAGSNQRVRDELVTQGRAYGLGKAESRSRSDELIEALDLGEFAARTAATLSGGQRRRVDIALGIMHRPRLIFLDEPTTGMDPHSRANLWEHILRLRTETGATIVLTTHYLEEADSMAERVIVVDKGVVIADDKADALKDQLASDLVELTLGNSELAARAARLAENLPQIRDVTTAQHLVRVRTRNGDAAIPALLREAEACGIRVQAVGLTRPTLDDVFLGLTGRSLRETAPVRA